MKVGKYFSPNGIIFEFFCMLWKFIEHEYLDVLYDNIVHGLLLLNVTQGIIALLYKRRL